MGIIIQRAKASDIVVGQLKPGQYFGEMQLLHGKTPLGLRACFRDDAVEVYKLDYQTMNELLNESVAMREVLSRVADERRTQNRTILGD
jgi:CRP-like cAMP-binding protein